jgi:hypothetical protein
MNFCERPKERSTLMRPIFRYFTTMKSSNLVLLMPVCVKFDAVNFPWIGMAPLCRHAFAGRHCQYARRRCKGRQKRMFPFHRSFLLSLKYESVEPFCLDN